MPDASTITARSTTSNVASPEMDAPKSPRVAHGTPSLVAKEPAVLDVSAPSSPVLLVPPREPVTYRSTATQIQPPRTGTEFVQIYGYEPKMHDFEHKMGLAAIGRYKHPDDIPYGVIHGAPFQPAHSERKPPYTSSSFQIMSLGARNLAVARAKVKAGMTAMKFKDALAEDGEKILTQSKDDEIVHSEQHPSIIKLNKDGSAQPGQDLTGRCFWNVFREKIKCDDEVKCQQPAAPQILPWSMLHTQRLKKLRPIASLEPSSQYDLPDPVVEQDFSEYDEYMQEEDLPYAADDDAFVVFDAAYHVPRNPRHEPLFTPVQSRKRKDSSQLSDERDSKRSRLREPSTTIPLDTKHDASAHLDTEPSKNSELTPSLPSSTAAALPRKDQSSQDPQDGHAQPYQATLGNRHADAGPLSSSRLIDASRTEHRHSKSRGDRTRARSRSPARSDNELSGSRKYRDRREIKPACEETTALDQNHSEEARSQAVQVTPTPANRGYNDETDLSESHTSSSPPSSRSTLASSYGSNKSTPTCEPHDEHPVPSALATSNSVAAHTITTGSPAPLRRVQRDIVKEQAPQVQEGCATPQAFGPVEQDVGKPQEPAAESTQPKQHDASKVQEQELSPNKKRALAEVDTDPSEVLQDQERSKRPKKQLKARKQEPEPGLNGDQVVEQQDKVVQEGAETATLSRVVPDVADKIAPLNNAEVSKKGELPAEQEERETKQQGSIAQGVVESAKSEMKTEDMKEKVETDQAKPEMSDTQKKLAARRAARASKADGRPYVPPARRTNAAGNAPTANQNRVVGNKHRRG